MLSSSSPQGHARSKLKSVFKTTITILVMPPGHPTSLFEFEQQAKL